MCILVIAAAETVLQIVEVYLLNESSVFFLELSQNNPIIYLAVGSSSCNSNHTKIHSQLLCWKGTNTLDISEI